MEIDDSKRAGAPVEEVIMEENKVKIKVLLFARARELMGGGSEFDLAVKEGATTANCVAELTTRFAALEVMRDSIVVALNFDYVTDPVKVKDGHELAIIPPISGG
ncbi:hypothetical protein R1flu_013487 [Riccia fluitans]|uniref:Molybdopterin synthase sulfur carrier subunit n=1 Tax=Riccia fluitans TaxID=41844 RepID=A0ABD1YDH7_9MARC